jgi:hypothetical protein
MKKEQKEKLDKTIDKMLNIQYNPGSLEAEQHGCICPIMDNGHGRGYMGQKDVFVFSWDCPLHGKNGSQSKRVPLE